MKIGFTGTRDGMTAKQYMRVSDWLQDMQECDVVEELHHGCCVGADADFQKLIIRGRIGSGEYAWGPNHAHPCDIKGMVCLDTEAMADEVRRPLPPLERNRNIVNACDVLLACPKGPEELRSGTWSTVRFARKCGKRVVVFWPDGSISEDNS